MNTVIWKANEAWEKTVISTSLQHHLIRDCLISECCQLLCRLLVSLVRADLLLCIHQWFASSLLAVEVCCALDLTSLLKSMWMLATLYHAQVHSLTYLATTSWYFQPNSWPTRPTVQYLRPGFRRRIRRACGTTTRFCLSYGGGIPSKTFKRCIAAAPRAVLCGIMPLTVRQKILEGARKWNGPNTRQWISLLELCWPEDCISYLHELGCNEWPCGERRSTSLLKTRQPYRSKYHFVFYPIPQFLIQLIPTARFPPLCISMDCGPTHTLRGKTLQRC